MAYNFEDDFLLHTRESVLHSSDSNIGRLVSLVVREKPFGNYPASLVTMHMDKGLLRVAQHTLDFRLIGVSPFVFRTSEGGILNSLRQSEARQHVDVLFPN